MAEKYDQAYRRVINVKNVILGVESFVRRSGSTTIICAAENWIWNNKTISMVHTSEMSQDRCELKECVGNKSL